MNVIQTLQYCYCAIVYGIINKSTEISLTVGREMGKQACKICVIEKKILSSVSEYVKTC